MADEKTVSAANGNIKNLFTGAQEAPTVDGVRTLATANATAPNDNQEKIAEMQRVLLFRIAALKASAGSPMPQGIADQIDLMESALATGNLTVLSLAYTATVAAKGSIEGTQAQIAAANAIAMQEMSSLYPDFGEYSPEAQAFISRELTEAFEKSADLKELKKRYDAMPAEEKASAKAEQGNNQKAIKAMLEDDSFKDIHEHLRIMRSTGMASGPDAQEILVKLQKREISADEFKQTVLDGVARIAAKNDGFIQEYIKTSVPKQSQDALQADKTLIDADGRVDSAKLTLEWGKIRLRDKEAAYKALAASDGDVSKLSPEHQRTIHMAQVMVAAETKTTIEGAMAIMARNQEVAKKLTDPTLSVEEKMAVLEREERRQGIQQSDQGFYKQGLRQTVLAINETVKEGRVYDPSKPSEFLSFVGDNVKENYKELLDRKPNEGAKATQADVRRIDNAIDAKEYNPYQKLVLYAGIAKSEEAPSWYSEEEKAKYKAEWQAVEDRIKLKDQVAILEANGVTPAEMAAQPKAGEPTSIIMSKTDEEKILEELKAKGMKFDGGASAQVASTATPEAASATPPVTAAQAVGASASAASSTSVVAATASPLPPGYPKDLPSLASLGVTGGTQPPVAEQQEPKGHLVSKTAAAAQEISGQAY
jgi:hypothetical protein